MIKKIRILPIILAGITVFGMAGCGTKTASSGDVSDEGQKTQQEAPADDAKGQQADAGQVTLTLWSQWSSDADGMKKPLDTVLANYEKENPNIKIEMDVINTEAYKQKVKVASAADELPDVFFSWGAGFAKPFVDAGKVLDLTPYVDDGTKERMLPGTLNSFTYDGKIYGLPSYIGLTVLYCNQELFDKYKAPMPETYEDLLEDVRIFREAGITPISVGEKELWPGIMLQNALALRTAGIDACMDALEKKTTFDTPEFIESGDKLAELVKAGAFSEGCMGVEELEAEADFANEKAAMILMGDWAAATFEQEDAPVKGKVTILNFPSLENEKDPGAFMGGAIDTFMISAGTEHPDESVALLKYLCENLGKEGYKNGASLPAWTGEVEADQINPLTKRIAELSQEATGMMLAWDTILEGADADTHLNAVAELFGGKSDGKAFVEAMDSINQ